MIGQYQIINTEILTSMGLNIRLPFEIGSLEEGSLAPLVGWRIAVDVMGYGMAHKIMTKKSPTDGQPSYLLYFWLPVAKNGHPITMEIVHRIHEKFLEFIVETAPQISELKKTEFIPLNPPVPGYMVGELEEAIRKLKPSLPVN